MMNIIKSYLFSNVCVMTNELASLNLEISILGKRTIYLKYLNGAKIHGKINYWAFVEYC